MLGLDTNVLVRFVTQDDESQFQRVSKRLKANCTDDSPGWISSIVLCEIVWVLSSGYDYKKAQILELLEQLLIVSSLQFENRSCVRTAINHFRDGKADFSDYLIAAINKEKGCRVTITLDRRAARHPDFELA